MLVEIPMIEENDLETLVEAGLTPCQAKVYLAIIMAGNANGKAIWQLSGVGRQDVYRLIDELLNLGLIEKTITRPMKYHALQIDEGLDILLKRKADDYQKLKQKIAFLLQKVRNTAKETTPHSEQFIYIPGREAHEHRIDQATINAQYTIDMVTVLPAKFSRPLKAFHDTLPQTVKDAVVRGVRVRQLTNRSINLKKELWRKKGSYELRFVDETPPVVICLIDEKELFFTVEPKLNPLSTDVLWTNNAGLIKIFKQYFETTWQDAAQTTAA